MKVFRKFRIARSFYRCPPLFPVDLAIYYERLAERVVVFFLSIISQRINKCADKDIFVNILTARFFSFLINRSQVESPSSSFGNISFILSR